jgi:hypothetical protein
MGADTDLEEQRSQNESTAWSKKTPNGASYDATECAE